LEDCRIEIAESASKGFFSKAVPPSPTNSTAASKTWFLRELYYRARRGNEQISNLSVKLISSFEISLALNFREEI